LAIRKDANGNTETYTYDAYQSLTAIPDRQQTFTYATCPTTNATGCVSAPGQLVQATFGTGVGPEKLTFAYNYAYTPAGKVSSKTLAILTTDGVHICLSGVQLDTGFGVLDRELYLRQSGRVDLHGIYASDISWRRPGFHLHAGRPGPAHRHDG